MAALYEDDAVLNPPHHPAVKGRTAIQAWLEKFLPMTAFKASNVKVEGRDDLAAPLVPPGLRLDLGQLETLLDQAFPAHNNPFAYPAQSNFTGVKHPLELVSKAQSRGP